MSHNCRKASGTACKSTAITDTRFNVTHNGTLRYSRQGQNVPHHKISLSSTINELPGIHALGCHHEFSITLKTIGILKLDLSYWGTTSRIMNDFLHHTLDVSVSFRVID